MGRYTPKPIDQTTWELEPYTPDTIANTTFVLAPDGSWPELFSPDNQTTGESRTPTFTWEAFQPASDRRYQVLVTSDTSVVNGVTVGDFTNALKYITANTSFTIPPDDQLAGSTTYYWKIIPATAIGLTTYSETFTVADQSAWVSPWVTETIDGTGTQTITANKATLGINAGGKSVARLGGVTFDSFDIYLRNHSFSDVSQNSQPTYHFRTQGGWRADNFITGYFLWMYGTQVSLGRIPEGLGPNIMSGGTSSFTRLANTDYDIHIKGDGFRFRVWIWESSTTQPTTPIIDIVDDQSLFSSGEFGIKLAGNNASSIAIDSINMDFGSATSGITVTSFAIDQADQNLSANSSKQLTTTTQGTNVSGGATFSSSNTNVVTVDNTGTYSWVGQGTATITAISIDDPAKTDTIQITALVDDGAGTLDSIDGDFIALQALYNSTQGNGVEVLASAADLPTPSNATYPYIYIINDEIYALSKERNRGVGSWVNHGAIWKDKTGWETMTAQTMGDAVGVEVDANGRVTKLDLQKIVLKDIGGGKLLTMGNGVVGTLPPEIGNLKKIEWFNLKQNFFFGEIPDVFAGWDNLERWSTGGQNWELDLDDKRRWHEADHIRISYDDNPFTISSAGIGKAIKSTNNFQGQLPASLGSLPNLQLIEARHQYFFGSLPQEWGSLPSIRGIFLNDIRGDSSIKLGEIPTSWGNLNTISVFHLSNYHTYSRFSGPLPDAMKNWDNLANIMIDRNNFNGSFPVFTNLLDLNYFVLGHNDFTGTFPWSSIFNGNNSRLSKLTITNNGLDGELPQTIPPATYPVDRTQTYGGRYVVSDITIGGNNFSGDLPSWLTDMAGLQIINITSNNFTGGFPENLLNQSNLKTVYLNNNNLSGTLPSGNWATDRIRWFYINHNNFEGEIPDSWQTLFQYSDGSYITDATFARYLFHNNNFSGRIPDWGKFVQWNETYKLYTFSRNKYTFKDIVPTYTEIKNVLGDGFGVAPQQAFGTQSNLVGTVIDFSAIVNHVDNEYMWQKDGNEITGETTSSIDTATYGTGTYMLTVTNTNITELTLNSINITI